MKAQQSYDFTAQRVLAAIAPVEGYCTSEVTESVKRHLTSALAGNFDPPRSNKADPDSRQ